MGLGHSATDRVGKSGSAEVLTINHNVSSLSPSRGPLSCVITHLPLSPFLFCHLSTVSQSPLIVKQVVTLFLKVPVMSRIMVIM